MNDTVTPDPTEAPDEDFDDEPSEEHLAALYEALPDAEEFIHIGGATLEDDEDRHGCPGQLESWIYAGADGHTHVAWTVWYSCEGLLEILSDVAVP